jgi:hypothetical protein
MYSRAQYPRNAGQPLQRTQNSKQFLGKLARASNKGFCLYELSPLSATPFCLGIPGATTGPTHKYSPSGSIPSLLAAPTRKFETENPNFRFSFE